MMIPPQPDPLRVALRRRAAELSERLHEACEADTKDVLEESTDEVERLRDSLLSAADAAEELVLLRRSRREHGEEHVPGSPLGAAVDADTDVVRDFRDDTGRAWRAWAVFPTGSLPLGYSARQLAEYEKGWLAFEALDGGARKRLPNFPSDWAALDDPGLRELLARATKVPHRRHGSGGRPGITPEPPA